MVSSERALWKAIKSGAFERAYYFFGDEEYAKEQALQALVAAAADAATREFNLDIRDAASIEPELLESLLHTPPMMAERRVVVLRNMAALGKASRKPIESYLSHPAPDILLVLVAAGGEKSKPDRSWQSMTCPVEFAPLTGERVSRWIGHHVSTELGAAITPGAAALLESVAGSELRTLAAELDKLVSYTNGGEIDEAAVTAVVGVRRGEGLPDLLDAVGRRDARAALALVPQVLEQPKTSAVSVVMALTTQTLALAWGESLRVRGSRADFWELLKSAPGSFTGRPWSEAAHAWSDASSHWDAPALDSAIAALLAADVALKETRLSADDKLLSTLVLAMCESSPAARSPHSA